MVYYNENDPKTVLWLQELIKQGCIADGEVDSRSIVDVQSSDLVGFAQCHFFAGVGGWSYALRLAGWSDEQPVWTGSCPCQPFSSAGKQKGFKDPRHLWPEWYRLIAQCRPPIIFGEQVATALSWFDLVSGDLENEDYAVGAAIVGAHSVGAPHIRQRLYFVAESNGTVSSDQRLQRIRRLMQPEEDEATGELADSNRSRRGSGRSSEAGNRSDTPRIKSSGLRLEGRCLSERERANERSPWASSNAVWCRDGKFRPVEPGSFPLAHGVPARVGRLRGYGNAIVPQVAAAFIQAYCECLST